MNPPSSVSRPLAIGWLLLVGLVIVLAFDRGPAFDSSILALLPESEQQPLVQRASDKLGAEFSDRLILLVAGRDEIATRAVVTNLADSLQQLEEVAAVKWQVGADEIGRLRDELFAYRFSVIDADIQRLLSAGAHQQVADQALLKLFSPISGSANALIEDPFGLYLDLTRNRRDNLNLELTNGLLKLGGTEVPTYLLTLKLAGDPFSPNLQRNLLATIEAQRVDSIDSIRMAGMLVHAAAGAKQVKGEISTIGLGSLVGIVVVMLWVFGRIKPLLLLLFPVAVGCLFAAAVTLLVFGRVHLVTFAFGAGLVGVSIDYALHFLCERRYSPSDQILSKILTGLSLGLFSSVMAYAVMLLTPFPGLRQMATFSVAGLFASWLTVVLWLPWLTRQDEAQALAAALSLDRFRHRFPRLDNHRWLWLLPALVLALALAVLWHSEGQDDVRLLQTSPPQLLQQEREIHRALGSQSSSQYLLVNADTLEQCLQKEELLTPALEQLKAEAAIGAYQALSATLPSLQRQAQNYRLVSELYRRQLDALYRVVKLSEVQRMQAQARFEGAAELRLTPAAWAQLGSGAAQRDLILQRSPAATVIRFEGTLDDGAKTQLVELAGSVEGVIFVDQVANITSLLKKYRKQIQNWIIIAYLIVFLALLIRYRRQVWRILLPPLAASLVTLAILVQVEQGINLFHLMALILVLGIGLDMGIFLQETDEAAHTWLAVSLSAFTSLLAFGLLALSDTPVLHHFGLTVAIGLSLVWLLSPTVRRRESRAAI